MNLYVDIRITTNEDSLDVGEVYKLGTQAIK